MMSVFYRRIILRRTCQIFKKLSTSPDFMLEEVSDSENKPPHEPIMVKEVIKSLNLKEGDIFLDMTFGAGGHSKALLEEIPNLQIFALDRDPVAVKFAAELQDIYPGQIIPLTGKFSDLPNILENYMVKENTFGGVLFDLGCSSMQLDTPERGFSFNKDGPLDMRMGEGDVTAADVIAFATEEDLLQILKVYGGEKNAKNIARAIVQARSVFKPLRTTKELSDLVDTVLGGPIRRDKFNRRINPATKVFQALRIFINNELNELNFGLQVVHKYLKPGGRAAVISFHSGEDQITKKNFKNVMVNKAKSVPLIYFSNAKNFTNTEINDFKIKHWEFDNEVIVPTDEEQISNPRCRSSKLIVATKV